jgi:hypothetical protein
MRRLALVFVPAIWFTVLTAPAFAQTTISGQVTSGGAGGSALTGVTVMAFPVGGGTAGGGAATDGGGNYVIQGLTPGVQYRVTTTNELGYVNEQYDNVQCIPACGPSLPATPVQPGDTNIDFDLERGGRISGTVTGNGSPLAFVGVSVVTTSGNVVAFTSTTATGFYRTPAVPIPGTYIVQVAESGLFLAQQSASLDLAGDLPGQDFALIEGGRFSGVVTDVTTGQPIGVSTTIRVQDSNGAQVASAVANALTGAYSTRVLPAGTYRISASASTHISQSTLVAVGAGETASISFALEPGGTIGGTVSSASGVLLPNITVQILDTSGTVLSTNATGPTGQYTSPLLPLSQSYYVRTVNFVGYVDELYDNQPCAPTCSLASGTLVQPSAQPNTNFVLNQVSRITGRVTDAATGTALNGVNVRVFDSAGTQVASVNTFGSGTYATGALAPGTYFVRTANSLGYLDQSYQNLPCAPTCNVTQGNPVVVIAGAATENINFALSLGGRISGAIRDASTGAGLGGVTVQVFNAAGVQVTSINTSTQPATLGTYTTTGLADGSYFVRTTNNLGYVNQLHSGLPCAPTCTVTAGTPVAVTAPNLTTVDFHLTLGARISGTVTDDNGSAPIGGVTVQLFSSSGVSLVGASTAANGTYTLNGLAPGTYFLRTFNTLGYLDEAYNDIVCLSCPLTTTGVPIVLTSAQQLVIPIGLAKGGQITGRVTDASGTGLGQVTVTVFDAAGRQLVVTTTSNAAGTIGNYATSGLPEGAHFVRAVPAAGSPYVAEVFDNLACLPCRITDGTLVSVTVGAVANVNIALEAGGRISGSVTDSATGTPIAGIAVDVISSSGGTLLTATTNASGIYTTGGLPAGSYFARTRTLPTTPAQSQGYVNVVFDDITCSGCNPVTGTPIDVTPGQITTDVSFALDLGGRVAGRVQDTSMQDLAGITVRVFSSGNLPASVTTTNANGEYLTPDGLAAGSYYARTDTAAYVDELHEGLSCTPGCTPSSGTSIDVSTGVTGGVDFTLEPAGRIAGTITDGQGQPLSRITVTVHDQTGATVASGLTNASGAYLTDGLVPGDYFVRTSNNVGLVDEVYRLPSATPCLGCDPQLSGTAITVATGATVGDIDFSLDVGGRVSGTVTDPGGAPLAGVRVDIYVGQATKPATGGLTNALGVYLTPAGLPAGTVTARTGNSLGYANQHNDQVVASPPATTANIDFALSPDLDIDGDGILDSVDGSPLLFSDAFSDATWGGTTTGTVVTRSGWAVSLSDTSPGGIFASLAGAGFAAAVLQTCAVNGAEEVWLDTADEAVSVQCADGSGSTTVRAVAARPFVELRKTVGDVTTSVLLAPGQIATLGSPVIADPSNLGPLQVRILDQAGIEIGTFALDPGESAGATQSAAGVVTVTVFSGVVTATVGNETATIGIGESYGFNICTPLAIEQLTASSSVLWPPNHKMVSVTISPTLAGTCGMTTCEILSVTSSEAVDSAGGGNASTDWEIGTGLTLQLRAERSGTGSGHVYTITVRCTDSSGNTAMRTVTVTVPLSSPSSQ